MSLAEQFQAELSQLGGKVFLAPDAGAAREYIANTVRERGGPVRTASRAAVEKLGLEQYEESPLAAVHIGITQADYALADTGTLVVFSQPGEGRALSLLPPVHIAVLEESRILAGLDELIAREPNFPELSSAMIFITGPSRTADIEKTLSVGVHGPGELHVVVVGGG